MVNENTIRKAAVSAVSTGFDLDAEEGDSVTMKSSSDKPPIVVRSMIDGGPRPIAAIDFDRVMMKRLPDGRPAFWVEGLPGEEPPSYETGTLKCFLYPEFDDEGRGFDRGFVDSVGLVGRTCNMNNTEAANRADFKNLFEREAHEQSKHRDEKKALEASLEQRRVAREADERVQDRAAMLALAGSAAGATAPVAEPAKEVTQFICDVQGCNMECSTERYLGVHKDKALDEAHRRARGEEV